MRGADYADLLPRVAEIVGDVRDRGDVALRDWAEQLDGSCRSRCASRARRSTLRELDDATLAAVRELARTVREFHELQRPEGFTHDPFPGVETERRWLRSSRSACTSPAGRRRCRARS